MNLIPLVEFIQIRIHQKRYDVSQVNNHTSNWDNQSFISFIVIEPNVFDV